MKTCKNYKPPRQFPCKSGITPENPLQPDDQFINARGQDTVTCEACRIYSKSLKKKKREIKKTFFNLQFANEGHRLWFIKTLKGDSP